MPRLLIINADDFGLSREVNGAVVEARRFGLLTSASLMVTGPAVDEAVGIARDDPGLAVGLHLALSRAVSALPRESVSRLVDANSEFPRSAVTAGLRYYFDREARRQLRSEIEAQFERFAGYGIPMSHVDGHLHLHAHPIVLPIVIELAERYGATGIRVPHDPLWPNLLADRSHLGYKLGMALGHGYLTSVCRRLLRRTNLAWCDASIGCMMSGRMNPEYAVGMLSRMRCERLEMFLHPSLESATDEPLGPNPRDLRALLSPDLKRSIEQEGFELATYPGIARRSTDAAGVRG